MKKDFIHFDDLCPVPPYKKKYNDFRVKVTAANKAAEEKAAEEKTAKLFNKLLINTHIQSLDKLNNSLYQYLNQFNK